LPLEKSSQRVAAGAHPFLAVRRVVPVETGHTDVLPRRSAVRVRSDVPVRARRVGTAAAGLAAGSRADRAGMGARLPLRRRPARAEVDTVRGAQDDVEAVAE